MGCLPITHMTLTYLKVPIPLEGNVDVVQQLLNAKALRYMVIGRQRGSLLVCCETGTNSSAIAILLYLMRVESMSFKDALVDLMKCRKFVQPDLASCNQLMAIEQYNTNVLALQAEPSFLPNKIAWYKIMKEARDKAGI